MRLLRVLMIAGGLALSACAAANPGTEVATVSGARAFLSEPVAVDIVEAQFNIPFLLPQIDSVQQTLRDNGTVVQEAYFSGDARVAVVEHVYDFWFNHFSIASAQSPDAFQIFLDHTPMQGREPEVIAATGQQTFGFLALDGPCVAFRFVKRIKQLTSYASDFRDPDTFVAGFTCGADGEKFVELFGFMTAEDKARVDRRNSI